VSWSLGPVYHGLGFYQEEPKMQGGSHRAGASKKEVGA